MTKRGKQITFITIVALILGAGWIVWNHTASTTRIALVNFQAFQTTGIVRANADRFIRYKEVSVSEAHKLSNYDFVLAFGMGLQITTEQREQIQKTADAGTPVYIFSATSPENNICNLDSIDKARISAYLSDGNKKNYQSLARYIRQSIDKKTFFVNAPDSAVKSASDVLFHLDESVYFEKVTDYEEYLKNNNYYKENAPKIAIVGGLNDPFSGNKEDMDSLVVSLQGLGLNVYPVSSFMKRLDFLKEIQPDAVIYFAHGRMVMGQADAAVDWLKARNIPIFAPITLLQTKEEWLADPMGMFGGFMSQSIVMPELDGAIYPYVLNAQEMDENGLYLLKAIPERLHTFTQIVNNFVTLQKKNNADKKIAVYYFKGAGQSTLTAQGLETVPALYNFLKRLKAEGYKVDNLPAEIKDFEKILMTQGAVMSTYANGVFDDFLKNGHPALIEKQAYETWVKQSLSEANYADVTALYGEAPGNYMSVKKDDKSYLAVARISFGNVVLLPQPMAGLGSDAFAIVHGSKSAPPHTYIAAYLWSQYDFKADAILHFGTHGSLEFTPQKQVALSHNDWPDRLVGAVPHFYYYTIGNIGESMMAKRRSYATTISYLTPPFMESDMRSQFKTLQDKIRTYYKTEENRQAKSSLEVKNIAVAMGLHRDLRLDSVLTNPYSTEDIERIENFAEEIANEKMTGSLYISGIPYPDAKIRSTVLAMSADPIAYSIAKLDRLSGKINDNQLKNKSFFTQKYLEPAQSLVNRILNGATVNEELICST
ncbi:MAG: cobaltochelatase subunit CobN, partial [Candidatus Symbiothrix sp.]|nr:cobaltochelatase subunit CobN [Candidatus Symbiothrix sp.]